MGWTKIFSGQLKYVLLATLASGLLSVSGRPWASPYLSFVFIIPFIYICDQNSNKIVCGLSTFLMAVGMFTVAYEGVMPMNVWVWLASVIFSSTPFFTVGIIVAGMLSTVRDCYRLLLFPLYWTAVETATSVNFLWGSFANPISIGLSQIKTPVSLLAFWSGPQSVTLGLLLMSSIAYYKLKERNGRFVLLALAIIAFIISTTRLEIQKNMSRDNLKMLNVAIIQGSINNFDTLYSRFDDKKYTEATQTYINMTNNIENLDDYLVIWPESSIPRNFSSSNNYYDIQRRLSNKANVIAGGFRQKENLYYNTIFLINSQMVRPVYDKRAPAPYFESYLTAGKYTRPLEFKKYKVGLGICWDSLMSSYLRNSIKDGAESIVFITNDTFAGNTITPYYHSLNSSMRAIESGRFVIHASQSGPSVVFSPLGIPSSVIEKNVRTILKFSTPQLNNLTPYIIYGNWIGSLSILFLILNSVLLFKNKHYIQSRGIYKPNNFK